jgi:UDP-glucose 4-epimerase
VRLLGKAPVPVVLPLASPVAGLIRRLGMDFPVDQLGLLLYGRGVDTSRLAEEFGWRPKHSTREALLDFVRARSARGPVTSDRVEEWDRRIRAALGRPVRAASRETI